MRRKRDPNNTIPENWKEILDFRASEDCHGFLFAGVMPNFSICRLVGRVTFPPLGGVDKFHSATAGGKNRQFKEAR
jgi:hypothetical protein